MIDLSKFNLTYFAKDDGREVKAYIPETGYITIFDNGEPKKYSTRHAREIYRPCKSNSKGSSKPKYAKPKLARRDGFEEYLNDGFKKVLVNY
jgi:hypothetical protein